MTNASHEKTVVVVGGGFGGINAVKALSQDPALRIVVVDKKNHHLFQPLLYQVATAGLAPSDIASPIRGIFSKSPNVEVIMGEVVDVDAEGRSLHLSSGRRLRFDYLVLACGAEKNYFGHKDWEKYAPSLKSLEDAIEIRKRILMSYERAETSTSQGERKAFMTYVIVGGGPTGVELAGAISEIAHNTLRTDFRNVDPDHTEVYLIEAGPRILSTFAPELSERAKKDLEKMNVRVLENTRVQAIEQDHVVTPSQEFFTPNIIWTAGVRASDLGKALGVPIDPQGRVIVQPDLSVPGFPFIFVIGDMAHVEDKRFGVLPGVAPVAMQEGTYVGDHIRRIARGPVTPLAGSDSARSGMEFRYVDKGNMATIGRKLAVVEVGKMKMTGVLAWLFWLLLHVYFLIGFKNKAVVIIQWAWSYITFNKGSRLITGPSDFGEHPTRQQTQPQPQVKI